MTLRVTMMCACVWIATLATPAWAARAERTTYRAELAPVDRTTTMPAGAARLVDAKTNNYATLDVRGLQPGSRYPWHVQRSAAGVTDPCAQGAAQGPIDTRFVYEALTAGQNGTAKATARSQTFDWDAGVFYVNIHDPISGSPIACGVLTP
jgi:hypothetical protein